MPVVFRVIPCCENAPVAVDFFVDAHLFIFCCVNLAYGKESIFAVPDNYSC